MEQYVSLLRAINVSGTNKLPMRDLVALCADLGYAAPQHYLQSGNLVFQAPRDIAAASTLEAAIQDRFSLAVTVWTSLARDFAATAAANPFLGRADIDPSFLHLVVCCRPLPRGTELPDLPPLTGQEDLAQGNDCVYLYLPHGSGRTKLNNAWFERKLGVPCTTRNWRTVRAVCDLAGRGLPV